MHPLRVILAVIALAICMLIPLHGESNLVFTRKDHRQADVSDQETSHPVSSFGRREQSPAYQIAEALRQQLRQFGDEASPRKEIGK